MKKGFCQSPQFLQNGVLIQLELDNDWNTENTYLKRPDMLEKADLDKKDMEFLKTLEMEQ